MSSIANNPFQLQRQKPSPAKFTKTSKPVPQVQAPSAPTFTSESRAFGAVKMARFMAQDSYQSSQSIPMEMDIRSQFRPNQPPLRDTQSGLLQSLASPTRKRDASSLASETWLDDEAYGVETKTEGNPWIEQLKNGFLDLFFEPLPEQVTASEPRANFESTSIPQHDRPIGIAQLTRSTFSNVTSQQSQESPLRRLKTP